MSPTSREAADLKRIADHLGDLVKIMKAMNENTLGMARNIVTVLELLTEHEDVSGG